MTTYHCAACGRIIPGPTGAPCPYCRREARRMDLLASILPAVVALVGIAAVAWGWR